MVKYMILGSNNNEDTYTYNVTLCSLNHCSLVLLLYRIKQTQSLNFHTNIPSKSRIRVSSNISLQPTQMSVNY